MSVSLLISDIGWRSNQLDLGDKSFEFLGRDLGCLIRFLAVQVPEALIYHVIDLGRETEQLVLLS